MTVYMRTGEDSAVGMPLSVYLLAVLPLQLLWLGTKVLVVTLAALSVGIFIATRWSWHASASIRAVSRG